MALLKEANKKGATVIVVTHDPQIAQWASKTVVMVDGEFVGGKEGRE